MDDPFALRFESGERAGDLIPILSSAGAWTIGRRPGNSLQILDASVSGKHVEFRVEGTSVVVKDLGSTNGTRVGGQRIIEAIVEHDSTVHIGNVRMTLLDTRLEAGAAKVPAVEPEAPARPPRDREGGAVAAKKVAASTMTKGEPKVEPAEAPDTGPGVAAVSAERLARSKSRSLVGLLVIVLLLIAGGVTWFLLHSESGQAARVRPVVAVPGNLLAAGYSFEEDDDGWRSDDRATGGFYETPGASYSGEVGVEADLVAGEWAAFGSTWIDTSAGRRLTVRAFARADGALDASLGIELGNRADEDRADEYDEESTGQRAPTPGPALAWAPVTEGAGWTELELQLDVPPGYDRTRVLLRGDAHNAGADSADNDGGAVAFDDVSLVSSGATAAPAVEIADIELWALGTPASQLLFKTLDALLVTGLTASVPIAPPESPTEGENGADAAGGGRRLGGLTLGAATATGTTVTVDGLPAGADVSLTLRAESVLAGASVATIGTGGTGGTGGYRTHGASFEREQVDSLLVSGGRDLVRIGFSDPVTVRGAGGRGGVELEVMLGRGRSFEVQLDFGEERKRAEDIAHEARKAHRNGDLGPTLELWAELLDGFPFESGLVAEAEATRGEVIRAGMLEVRSIRDEVERARFFQLADLFRQCRESAAAIAERYAPSEVEDAAYEVVAELDIELATLEQGSGADEIARLESIAAGLESAGSEKLAEQVRSYVAQRLRESEED
jgi:hypothetical protein